MTKKRQPKTASLTLENQYIAFGCRNIVGIDEAGRGAWAGPVAVGAVCLPLADPTANLRKVLAGVRDSKEMTPRGRETLVEKIKETALAWGVGNATNTEIDAIGINPATKLAAQRALDHLHAHFPDFTPDCLFMDSMPWPEAPPEQRLVSIVDGDKRSLSVAAASVIAKVWRDQHMRDLEADYPGYDFALHKGYGTTKHRAVIKSLGVCAVHRRSYRPIREAE